MLKGGPESSGKGSSCNMDCVYARYLVIRSRGVNPAFMHVGAEILAQMLACHGQCSASASVPVARPARKDLELRTWGRRLIPEWVIGLFS